MGQWNRSGCEPRRFRSRRDSQPARPFRLRRGVRRMRQGAGAPQVGRRRRVGLRTRGRRGVHLRRRHLPCRCRLRPARRTGVAGPRPGHRRRGGRPVPLGRRGWRGPLEGSGSRIGSGGPPWRHPRNNRPGDRYGNLHAVRTAIEAHRSALNLPAAPRAGRIPAPSTARTARPGISCPAHWPGRFSVLYDSPVRSLERRAP
jgi:hypothetical protein